MNISVGQRRKNYAPALVSIFSLLALISVGSPLAKASAVDLNGITAISSENISTENSNNVFKIYLNTFRPNNEVYFEVNFHNIEALDVINDSVAMSLPASATLQLSVKSGPVLNQSLISDPIREIDDKNGNPIVQIFAAPTDFPLLSFTGDTSLIKKKELLLAGHQSTVIWSRKISVLAQHHLVSGDCLTQSFRQYPE